VDREPGATQSRAGRSLFLASLLARDRIRCSSFLAPALTLPPLLCSPFPPPPQSDDTLEKVRTIISEQLGTDLDAVAADAKFVDLGADSLDTVEIMMALEEQFEITLDEEGAEKIATVQEAADMIEEQMA
jgi:acyl carrier protein